MLSQYHKQDLRNVHEKSCDYFISKYYENKSLDSGFDKGTIMEVSKYSRKVRNMNAYSNGVLTRMAKKY